MKPRDNAGFFNFNAVKKRKNYKKTKKLHTKLSDKSYKQQMIYLKDMQGFEMTNKLKTYSNYIKDPLALFYDLTKDNKNNILFESSEIDTKAGTKSMLGIRSALRITSLDNIVTIKVLNNNGRAVVNNLLEVIREDQNTEIIKEELGIDVDRVNVKATTEERLGFTGQEEGMACHAVCLLEE